MANGNLMVWFALGYAVQVSTNPDEMAQERSCKRFHDDLRDASFCPELKKVATVGDGVLKIIDTITWEVRYAQYLSCRACHAR